MAQNEGRIAIEGALLRIAIWGVGAVGMGLASALADEDGKLVLLGRDPRTLEALATRGIERSGLMGERHVDATALRVESDPKILADDPPDWLLVCTKAFASSEIAARLEPLAAGMGTRTRLVLCQNGWGNEAPFLSFWPRERLAHARIITGFHRHAPHQVEITAHAAPIAFGSLFGHSIDGLGALADRVTRGGIPAEVRDDMESVLWAKMLYNCALNPLGALTNRRYGELTADAHTRELIRNVVEEIFEVLERANHRVDWPNAEAYLEVFYRDLIPPTAAHASSMLQDLRAGRPTEIEALCGAVEGLGARFDVATPVVSALARLVRLAEAREREPNSSC
jgi:2-dehydropantoate 2-reductase